MFISASLLQKHLSSTVNDFQIYFVLTVINSVYFSGAVFSPRSEGIHFTAKYLKKQKQLEFSQEETWRFKVTESLAEEQMGVTWLFFNISQKMRNFVIATWRRFEKALLKCWEHKIYGEALYIVEKTFSGVSNPISKQSTPPPQKLACRHFVPGVLATGPGAYCQIWRY